MRDNNDLCLSLVKLDGLQSADTTDHLPNSVVGIADIMVCSNLMFMDSMLLQLDTEAPKGTDLENYQVLDLLGAFGVYHVDLSEYYASTRKG